MRTKIKVIQHEDKTSKGTPPKDYTRFNCMMENGTSKWMSCFEKEVSNEIKIAENKWIDVETVDSTDGKFTNIRAFYGVSNGEVFENGNDAMNGIEEPNKYEPTSMYVSYAKDLFCALITENVDIKDIEVGKAMTRCVGLVKQAHEEFKNE